MHAAHFVGAVKIGERARHAQSRAPAAQLVKKQHAVVRKRYFARARPPPTSAWPLMSARSSAGPVVSRIFGCGRDKTCEPLK